MNKLNTASVALLNGSFDKMVKPAGHDSSLQDCFDLPFDQSKLMLSNWTSVIDSETASRMSPRDQSADNTKRNPFIPRTTRNNAISMSQSDLDLTKILGSNISHNCLPSKHKRSRKSEHIKKLLDICNELKNENVDGKEMNRVETQESLESNLFSNVSRSKSSKTGLEMVKNEFKKLMRV